MKFLQAILFVIALSFGAGAVAQSLTPAQLQAVNNALAEEKREKLSIDTAREWAGLISETLVESATKLGVAANEFIKTPTGMMVAGVIIYKVVGADVIRKLSSIPIAFLGLLVSYILWRNRERRVRIPVKYETREFWGIPYRTAVGYDTSTQGNDASGVTAVIFAIVTIAACLILLVA